MYYKYHKINFNPGEWYLDSPDWIKDKKATKNPINEKNNHCFQNGATVALDYEN